VAEMALAALMRPERCQRRTDDSGCPNLRRSAAASYAALFKPS
jgi:hypothetical protein